MGLTTAVLHVKMILIALVMIVSTDRSLVDAVESRMLIVDKVI